MCIHLPAMNFVAADDLNVEKLSSLGPVQQEKAKEGVTEVKRGLCAQLSLHHSPDSVDLLSK